VIFSHLFWIYFLEIFLDFSFVFFWVVFSLVGFRSSVGRLEVGGWGSNPCKAR
jgi:hypothetical protein